MPVTAAVNQHRYQCKVTNVKDFSPQKTLNFSGKPFDAYCCHMGTAIRHRV